MTKQHAVAALATVLNRYEVGDRGKAYEPDVWSQRKLYVFEWHDELSKFSDASFKRLWAWQNRGARGELARSVMDEVLAELGIETMDTFFELIKE